MAEGDVTAELDGLRTEVVRANAIFEASPLGMVMVNPAGFIINANRRAARMQGRTPADMIGLWPEQRTTPGS